MSLTHIPDPLMICGPSGTGKTYLAELLEKLYPGSIGLVLSTTERSPRTGEIDGRHYHFRDPAGYDELLRSGRLFMSNLIFGSRYGYNLDDVEQVANKGVIPTALVYTPVADQFVRQYPKATRIFLEPPNLEFLEARMKKRGDHLEDIRRRLDGVRVELKAFETHRALFPTENVIKIVDDTSVHEAVERIRVRYKLAGVIPPT